MRSAAGAARAAAGPALALGVAGTVEVLRGTPIGIPNPPAFLVLTVVAGAFIGGRASGLVAGVLAWTYIAYFFSEPGAPFAYSAENARRVAVWGVTIPATALLVGLLRDRALRESRRALDDSRRTLARERDLTRALTDANRTLADANEALESFSYVVSHDLRSPCGRSARSSRSHGRGREPRPTPDGRNTLAESRRAADRLAGLLAELLEVSRAARADADGVRPVLVEDVLRSEECATRYRDAVVASGARVEVATLVGTPPVLATPSALAQVLGNLVLNAVRHNPRPAPLVRVRTAPLDAEATLVEVVVEDNGPGFPADVRETFDEGSPATSRRSYLRGGFGLLIVRRAVGRLGGKVWLASSAEGGAAAHFSLPAAHPPAAATGEAATASPPPANPLP